MSPFAGYTGFRSSMDQVAGAVSNVGSLLGTGVYTLVSGTKTLIKSFSNDFQYSNEESNSKDNFCLKIRNIRSAWWNVR